MLDGCDRARDFSGNKCFASAGAFMIEQNAVARAQIIALAIIDRRPI